MNLLVTGGAGYIGSHVVEELCNAGENVVVFDNLDTGHRAAVDPRAEFICGDLKDADAAGLEPEILLGVHGDVIVRQDPRVDVRRVQERDAHGLVRAQGDARLSERPDPSPACAAASWVAVCEEPKKEDVKKEVEEAENN